MSGIGKGIAMNIAGEAIRATQNPKELQERHHSAQTVKIAFFTSPRL
jgi:citrate lyase alpha subunit